MESTHSTLHPRPSPSPAVFEARNRRTGRCSEASFRHTSYWANSWWETQWTTCRKYSKNGVIDCSLHACNYMYIRNILSIYIYTTYYMIQKILNIYIYMHMYVCIYIDIYIYIYTCKPCVWPSAETAKSCSSFLIFWFCLCRKRAKTPQAYKFSCASWQPV